MFKNIYWTGFLMMPFLVAVSAATEDGSTNGMKFLNAPEYIGPATAIHFVTNRGFQGIPSIAVSPGGRLWTTWYAGVTTDEDENNYIVVSTSADKGKTWAEAFVIDPDGPGPVRGFDPEIWMAPDGRMFVFWAQDYPDRNGNIAGVWCITTDQPDGETPEWTSPRRLTDGIMMCKPTVLSSGEWALPVSLWKTADSSARMVVSEDCGKSWVVRGACNVPEEVRSYDEQMIVERLDSSLWMLARTRYGIGESISVDGGKSWPELTPSSIPHPSTRFFITRLNSGALLLVKHGTMAARSKRAHLTAYISKNDGKTWIGGLLLDERSAVSYPDGQQASDGTIHIVYDYRRISEKQIFMSVFREEHVLNGDASAEGVRLRQLVSQASGGISKTNTIVKTLD